MDTHVITSQAVRSVLRDYWNQYKRHPWRAAGAFLLPSIGTIFVFFVPPLMIARLINLFVEHNEISLAVAAPYIVLFGVLWLVGEAFWRVGMHNIIQLEFAGIKVLSKLTFSRLVERDYDFYVNNF